MQAYVTTSILMCASLASALTAIDDSNFQQAFSKYNDDITGALSIYGGIEGRQTNGLSRETGSC